MRTHEHSHRPRHHRVLVSYPMSLPQKIYSHLVVPGIVVALILVASVFYPYVAPQGAPVSLDTMLLAAFATCARITIAYLLSLIVAVPLAIFVTSDSRVEALVLPIFDVLQSVPILVLFPVIVMLFVSSGFLNAAAIAILFLTMVWTMTFTLVGGIKMIPRDIQYAATIFGITRLSYIRRVLIPGIVPQIVTGSMLSVAQGWNIIIVAEVLHTYIPHSSGAEDLFGIGATLVEASANAQTSVFIMAVTVLVVIVASLNFFVWQNLLHFAERFRFE